MSEQLDALVRKEMRIAGVGPWTPEAERAGVAAAIRYLHSKHALCDAPSCPVCAERRAVAGFHGESIEGQEDVVLTCPQCGHAFDPAEQPVRATEATKTAPAKPYGDVEYADPGYQKDGKKRYPLDTARHVRAAWSYINQDGNAAKYKAKQLQQIKAKIKRAAKKLGVEIADKAAEAWINGQMSYSDISQLVSSAVRARLRNAYPDQYVWGWVVDLSATDVVYCAGDEDLFQCTYTVTTDETGTRVELGDPVEVIRTYAPATPETDVDGDMDEDVAEQEAATTEARDQLAGRVVEAKGTDAAGNRIFRVRVIAYGDSKNGRRYPETVMRESAPLYDGAKAYDHHRTDEELKTSTISGLIGYYRSPEATAEGIEADLHLLPSATHAVEALEASLAAQADGLDPLVGISHDVMATYKPIVAGGVRLAEATSILQVNSADIVANPAAGGQATRMVAGGITPETDPAGTVPAGESTKETDVAPTKADILAALKEATVDELAAVGLSKADQGTGDGKPAEQTTEATAPTGQPKDSFLGRLLVKQKVADANLPESVVESLTQALPERITESDVDAQISSLKAALGVAERAGLTPQHTPAQVGQEAFDKKKAALDAFFAKDYSIGYRSFREAFMDITGIRQRAFDEDFNRTILKESFGAGFSSAARSTESMDSTSWNLVLGDSITRRLVAEYAQPSLQTWRSIVSIVPVNDFRTQRIERIGGYGTLPVVNQGAPYQPLTSPGNEEAEYAINKKGGTEDITLEMIANDDIRSIQRIPTKLGLAAAQTLYRFVWDTFVLNAATSYDGTALFHANHGNTDTNALSQSNLSVGRRKMRKQTAYGDPSNVLSIVPKFLIVPSDLEELAFQLTTSAVAIPATPAGPSDTPNIHKGMTTIEVDYWTSATGWYLAADPNLVPTIEVGFYQGRQDPELFTQADQSVGSVFNADKITYKIRHIYSGTALDHRGLYRGNA